MNKYLATLIFYIASIALVFILSKLSPDAHDGGPGFGSLLIIVLCIVITILAIINIYRGIKTDSNYFILAAIHILVLAIALKKFFL